MKLLDQYIHAIGRQLPLASRNEIKKELKSLLLDEIENTYGPNPTDEELEAHIAAYGSPRSVANRYKTNNLVIGAGYTDLFLFIAKIIGLAVGIGFTSLMLMNLFTNDWSFNQIMIELAVTFGRVITGWTGGLGWLTLVFIILTRINNDEEIDMDEDWRPKELKDIQIGPESESRLESALSIFFLLGFTIVINVAPQLVTASENAFNITGLLRHTVDMDVFRLFLIPLSILWISEAVYHVFNLFYGSLSRNLAAYKLLVDWAGAAVMIIMVTSTTLYTNDTGFVGYRFIFTIVAIISSVEAISNSVKFIRHYLLGGMES